MRDSEIAMRGFWEGERGTKCCEDGLEIPGKRFVNGTGKSSVGRLFLGV